MLFGSLVNVELDRFVPLFGTIDTINTPNDFVNKLLLTLSRKNGMADILAEYEECCQFLYATVIGASGSGGARKNNSFKSYRSEVNKFLNWAWFIKKQPITSFKRSDLIEFVAFCASPPKHLIANASYAWFDSAGNINEKWRPFISQSETYTRKPAALETQLAVLSSLYDHFIEEGYETTNPAKAAKKKISTQQGDSGQTHGLLSVDDVGRAFSVEQWDMIWQVTEELATENPEKHERTRMIMLMLYWMFLRISEVSYRPGFAPYMGHFFQHPKRADLWLFHIPNSKGGKKRTIGVPRPVLDGLIRYRQHRQLSDLPEPDELVPLFTRHTAANNGRAKGLVDEPIGIDTVYDTVKNVYAIAADRFMEAGQTFDADYVRNAVVHQLRHTGITHDLEVRGRTIERVSMDAGHSSTQVTNRYVSRDTLERYVDSYEKDVLNINKRGDNT